MKFSPFVSLISACLRWRYIILMAGLVCAVVAGRYAFEHFAINSDTSALISEKVDWRQRESTFDQAFPQRAQLIVAVIDAPTADSAELSTRAFTAKAEEKMDLFQTIERPDANPYFAKEGLLFLSSKELEKTTSNLIQAQPFIGIMAADPSLRGLMHGFDLMVQGVQNGEGDLLSLAPTMRSFTDTLALLAKGETATFSWRRLMNQTDDSAANLRKFVFFKPVLDYRSLEPGAEACAFLRAAFKDVARQFPGARLRLTGPVALADDEFSTLADGADVNAIITLAAVLLILWLALKSWRLIGAVFLNLVLGLVITAAVGLALVGALNLISVAFAVLFVGLGVDFGMQYCVRYREERHLDDNLARALISAGREAGKPLALAAAATAAGFMSFLPTSYRGLSELGLIAGLGMLIAFATSVTFLPALIRIFGAPHEPKSMGFHFLAPFDRFMAEHRRAILIATAIGTLALAPFLWQVRFDFNPLHLRSAKVESVSTYLDLFKDPQTSPNTIDILKPSLADAEALAKQLRQLPQVDHVLTLASFVPEDQEAKLAVLQDAAILIGPSLDPAQSPAPANDVETQAALRATAKALLRAAGEKSDEGVQEARRLAAALKSLADAPIAQRSQAAQALLPPLRLTLEQIRQSLEAQQVTLEDIPASLRREWVTDDGRARIEVAPKGDGNDNVVLKQFVQAVLTLAPEATGTPVSIQASGKTIVSAFWQAGICALSVITLLLFLVLRRASDVALTLVPLLLAGVVTLELCGLLHLPLNFANIIALPLLLGVGVAFKVYFVMAWRCGNMALLQSSLTRAVFYSALTTATAFGSLWLSNHPGTASMGELMALALVCTLAAAVLFQPALMGPPRQISGD